MQFSIRTWLLATLLVLSPFAMRQGSAAEEPYCGLYSMYAALHAIGTPIHDFNEICISKYLSGDPGSTALDLVQIAEKYNAVGTLHTGMTVASLRAANSPVVLHTSVAVSETGFYHWVLFCGIDGDSVKLYDPPRGVYSVSSAELLSFWDGIGLTVQRPDKSPLTHAWTKIPAFNLELVFAFILVPILGVAAVRIPIFARYPVIGILAVACVSGAVWHAVVDYGFFRNHDALMNIASRFDRGDIPLVTTKQFRELAKQTDVAIVDARRFIAYTRSHVPGAVNVPITVTHGELRSALTTIPIDRRVVVYCQSKECGWADAIAQQFAARGYRRVSIFRNGMDGWETDGNNVQ